MTMQYVVTSGCGAITSGKWTVSLRGAAFNINPDSTGGQGPTSPSTFIAWDAVATKFRYWEVQITPAGTVVQNGPSATCEGEQ